MDLNELPTAPFRRHPWEVARARFFAGVVASANVGHASDGGGGGPLRVLVVGAGDGYLARQVLRGLPSGSEVTCVDANYSEGDIARLAMPPLPGLSFSRTRPAAMFDVVLLLDVIEHVADDRAFLAEIVETSVRPGGAVVISVPAWEALYGPHDVALKHFRRYRPDQCRALLRAAGLDVVRDGGLFHSLLLSRAMQRVSEVAGSLVRRTRNGANAADDTGTARPANLGEWRAGPLLSSLVTAALDVDTALSARLAQRGVALPGLSYWALGRRGSA